MVSIAFDIVIPEWLKFSVPVAVTIGAIFITHHLTKRRSHTSEMDTGLVSGMEAKLNFYWTVVNKLDRMLNNYHFKSMNDPEAPQEIHRTLMEIDDLNPKKFLDHESYKAYKYFRGPYDKNYSLKAEIEKRQKFADQDVAFRNSIAISHNKLVPTYNKKTGKEEKVIEDPSREKIKVGYTCYQCDNLFETQKLLDAHTKDSHRSHSNNDD